MTNVRAEPTWHRPRGSVSGFWVAGATAVVGVAAALVWVVVAALSEVGSTEDLARGDLPGSVTTHVAAVAGFEAKRAGSYRVDSPYIAVGEARLAVGEDVGDGFVHTLVGPTALAVASLLLASGIAALTAVRINRRYRRSS
jgi:hypothetical protein